MKFNFHASGISNEKNIKKNSKCGFLKPSPSLIHIIDLTDIFSILRNFITYSKMFPRIKLAPSRSTFYKNNLQST